MMRSVSPCSVMRYFQIHMPLPSSTDRLVSRGAGGVGWGSAASGTSTAGCHGVEGGEGGRGGGGQPVSATGPIGAGSVVVVVGGGGAGSVVGGADVVVNGMVDGTVGGTRATVAACRGACVAAAAMSPNSTAAAHTASARRIAPLPTPAIVARRRTRHMRG